jgi:calpain-15
MLTFISRYFDCIDICKVRAGWEEIRLLGTLQPLCSISCVLLTVLEPTEAEFTLFQEGQRFVFERFLKMKMLHADNK